MQEFNSISQNRKNIFFIVLRQIGTNQTRSDFLFDKKSSTYTVMVLIRIVSIVGDIHVALGFAIYDSARKIRWIF